MLSVWTKKSLCCLFGRVSLCVVCLDEEVFVLSVWTRKSLCCLFGRGSCPGRIIMIKVVNVIIIKIMLIVNYALFDKLFVVAMTSIYDQGTHLTSQLCIHY